MIVADSLAIVAVEKQGGALNFRSVAMLTRVGPLGLWVLEGGPFSPGLRGLAGY